MDNGMACPVYARSGELQGGDYQHLAGKDGDEIDNWRKKKGGCIYFRAKSLWERENDWN